MRGISAEKIFLKVCETICIEISPLTLLLQVSETIIINIQAILKLPSIRQVVIIQIFLLQNIGSHLGERHGLASVLASNRGRSPSNAEMITIPLAILS